MADRTRPGLFFSALAAFVCTVTPGLCLRPALAAPDKLNVLFIAVDDLRPELGCYGAKHIQSPNIDKLAGNGLLFQRAYCQQAVCSPSRTSLLTGRRPDSTGVYDLQTHFRINIPDVITLPQHFKNNGYHTYSIGKIYHGGLDDPDSWSVPSWKPKATTYHKPESREILKRETQRLKQAGKLRHDVVLKKDPITGVPLKIKRVGQRALGPAWEDPDVADHELGDGMVAEHAIESLRQMKEGKPFFLAVGFFKPHLPFIAPKKYFDLYPPETIRLAENRFAPVDVPQVAMHNFGELRSYSDIPPIGPVTDEKAMELVRAYYAATSFTDAQIGRVLDELDRLGLSNNTVVILWGDHGWHLGENGLWCKHSNFEVATHVPMVIRVPGQKHPGSTTKALAEYVDIYPTLCELCRLPLPDGLEGTSFAPLLDDPDQPWKKAAFSLYPRGQVMGRSIRTDRYRYTEWAEPGKSPLGIELYDHARDPGENTNLANRSETLRLERELQAVLHAGFEAARPPGQTTSQSEKAASASDPNQSPDSERPNILFAIADDWSFPHAGIHGDRVVRTPTFDRLAGEGVLFTQAYCAAPSCTPSRGAILTGQMPYRLEEGGNLWSMLPKRFQCYTDILEKAGYTIGHTRKGWGPGNLDDAGRDRNPAGPQFKNFAEFLKQAPADKPFCFWFGSLDPHRVYEAGSGIASGMKIEDVFVPPFLPDTPEVRSDICDYYFEVQRFDREVGELLKLLEETGRAKNTIVVMTSDNGMPFPRCKTNLYGFGTHMPLVIRWPAGIKDRRVINDFFSFTDFAPTFLEAAGIRPPGEMTGRSFLRVLTKAEPAPRIEVFVERERHAAARPGNLSYPARAIRTDRYLYIRNFKPDRWPAGDPDPPEWPWPFGDIDASPTKTLLLDRRNEPGMTTLFELSCGKRPAEELYDLRGDPFELNNVADDADYREIKRQLSRRLEQWMIETADPRATGDDDRWDHYTYYGRKGKDRDKRK